MRMERITLTPHKARTPTTELVFRSCSIYASAILLNSVFPVVVCGPSFVLYTNFCLYFSLSNCRKSLKCSGNKFRKLILIPRKMSLRIVLVLKEMPWHSFEWNHNVRSLRKIYLCKSCCDI